MRKLLLSSFALVGMIFCSCGTKKPTTPVGGTVGNMVDLGLSVKWADHNVGATDAEDDGIFVAWGETTPKENYSHGSYKWYRKKYGTETPYGSNGIVDNKIVLEAADDAATVNWGEEWRTPTAKEWDELRTKCKWRWTTKGGVEGYKVTASNGHSIFLPAAGYIEGSHNSREFSGRSGYYWTSSLDCVFNSNDAMGCNFYASHRDVKNDHRICGRSVRPVSAR